ncbi:MAG TPA: ATP-binding protein [Labilithrix sp.]|nr:ATP-binding protein [Labilithrix sp.]
MKLGLSVRARLVVSHASLALLVVLVCLAASRGVQNYGERRNLVRAGAVGTAESLIGLAGRVAEAGFSAILVHAGDEETKFFDTLAELEARSAILAQDPLLTAVERSHLERLGAAITHLHQAAATLFDAFDATNAAPHDAVLAYGATIDEVHGALEDLRSALTASKAREEADTRALIDRALLWIGLGGILVAVLSGAVLGRYFARPLVALRDAARAFGEGREAIETRISSDDEVGQLASAFDEMAGHVASRTEQLAGRNAQMRALLDHVAQGFFTIGADGRIGAETSAVVAEWFGAHRAGDSFAELLRRCDDDAGQWFDVAWESVLDGSLPLEVSLAQLPTRFRKGGQTFSLELTPISLADGLPTSALVVVTDISAELARENANATRLEIVTVLEKALQDRTGLMAFLAEGDALVASVAEDRDASLVVVKRAIHTLKGNAGTFGFSSVATLCHELESAVAESGVLAPFQRDELRACWVRATATLSTTLSKQSRATLGIERADLASVRAALVRGASHREIERQLDLLTLDPIAARFACLGEQASALAQRLEKQLDVQLRSDDLRCDTARWSPFWSAFTHVVRNAIDHGVEEPAERRRKGKSASGTLALRARLEGRSFILDVSDDGRGIDWAAVADRGRAAGLPVDDPRALEAALFHEGISTRSSVTPLSGRGVGLGAVQAACAALGGEIDVSSTGGDGTTLRFTFPRAALGEPYRVEESMPEQRAVA